MEDRLLFIEKCLKKFAYPNIYALKMAEIFGASNRIFLLSWLYELVRNYDHTTVELLSEETLVDFLNSHGFCKASQAQPFINCILEYPVQLNILYSIFKMLDKINNFEERVKCSDELTLRDLDNFKQTNSNIFQCFGPIKIDVDSEEIEKNAKVQEEYLKEKSKDFCLNISEVKELLKIEHQVKGALEIISQLSVTNETSANFMIKSNEGIDALRHFNKNVGKIKEYIQSTNIISRFSEELDTSSLEYCVDSDDLYTDMVKDAIRLILEVDNF